MNAVCEMEGGRGELWYCSGMPCSGVRSNDIGGLVDISLVSIGTLEGNFLWTGFAVCGGCGCLFFFTFYIWYIFRCGGSCLTVCGGG